VIAVWKVAGCVTRTGGDSRPVVGDVVSLVFGPEVLETGAECGGEAESGCTGLVVLSYELNRQRNNRINGCNCRGIAVMCVQMYNAYR
jgi:hypothetical protein